MKQMGKNSKNHELLHFRQNGTPYNAMEEEITKYIICSLMVREQLFIISCKIVRALLVLSTQEL